MKPHLMFFYLLTGKDAESHQLYFRPQNQWSSSGPHQFAPRYYVESLCDPALGINECLAPSGCLQGGATPIARTYGVHIYIYIYIYTYIYIAHGPQKRFTTGGHHIVSHCIILYPQIRRRIRLQWLCSCLIQVSWPIHGCTVPESSEPRLTYHRQSDI